MIPVSDVGGPAGQNPPSNPSFTQTVFPINVINTTSSFDLPDLAPGDILTEIFIQAQTQPDVALTKYDITFAVVNDLGQTLIPTTRIPGNCQSASATTNIFTFAALLPMLYRAAIQGRRLTMTIGAAGATIRGSVSLGVRRNFRPFQQWRT